VLPGTALPPHDVAKETEEADATTERNARPISRLLAEIHERNPFGPQLTARVPFMRTPFRSMTSGYLSCAGGIVERQLRGVTQIRERLYDV
jgi:hypothetical protein